MCDSCLPAGGYPRAYTREDRVPLSSRSDSVVVTERERLLLVHAFHGGSVAISSCCVFFW
jgi:hypothetical protein